MKTVNNLKFELYYADNYCSSFKSLDKAIKQAVDTYKNNEDMIGRKEFFCVKFGFNVIVAVKVIDNKIVIE